MSGFAEIWNEQADTAAHAEAAAWANPGDGLDECLHALEPIITAPSPVGEIGCGTGRLLHRVAAERAARDMNGDVYGVDVSRRMLAYCWAKNNPASPVHADLISEFPETLPDSWEDMGGIFSVLAFQHMPDDTKRRYLMLARRAVAPYGVLVVQYTIGDETDYGPINYPTDPGAMSMWAAVAGWDHIDQHSDPNFPTWRWLTAAADPIPDK